MDAGTFQKLTAMKDHEKISMDELFRGLSIVSPLYKFLINSFVLDTDVSRL